MKYFMVEESSGLLPEMVTTTKQDRFNKSSSTSSKIERQIHQWNTGRILDGNITGEYNTFIIFSTLVQITTSQNGHTLIMLGDKIGNYSRVCNERNNQRI